MKNLINKFKEKNRRRKIARALKRTGIIDCLEKYSFNADKKGLKKDKKDSTNKKPQ